MSVYAANVPKSHLTDMVLRHAASRDELRATRKAKKAKAKGNIIPFPAPARHLRATPILSSPADFEEPALRRSSILRSSTRHLVLRPLAFIRNVLQGALSGLMTFFGAIQISGGEMVPIGDWASELPASVKAIFAGLPAGAATGTLGIIGAAILFMNAGKGVARILGLMGFIAIATAYANGANGDDLIPYLTNLYHQIKGFLPLLAGLI